MGSTQDEARRRHGDGPLLVTATGQDSGRGRGGAGWLDADRALAASLAFRPGWDSSRLPVLTLVAGLAAVDVLPDRVSLKWPNDVMVASDKAGGILTEATDGLVIVGFGLNVAWAEPPAGMIGMHRTDPGVGHAREIAERWAARLLDRAAAGPDGWDRDTYVARCSTIGRRVEWEPDGAGKAVGVDGDGRLLVETAGRVVALDSGRVREVRSA